MLFLYDYPNWVMGTVIVAACLILTLAGYFIFRKLFGRDFSESQVGPAIGLVAVIATITSLLMEQGKVSTNAWNQIDVIFH